MYIEHPKAHYISFRSSEILKDLALPRQAELENTLSSLNNWAAYNYQSHVLGGKVFGKVNHFNNYKQACSLSIKDPLVHFKESFTYAYPNHFP
jgi:hypothetical protein